MRTHSENVQNICIDGKWANKMNICRSLAGIVFAAKLLYRYQSVGIQYVWQLYSQPYFKFSNSYKNISPTCIREKKIRPLYFLKSDHSFAQFFRIFTFTWLALSGRASWCPPTVFVFAPQLVLLCGISKYMTFCFIVLPQLQYTDRTMIAK